MYVCMYVRTCMHAHVYACMYVLYLCMYVLVVTSSLNGMPTGGSGIQWYGALTITDLTAMASQTRRAGSTAYPSTGVYMYVYDVHT